MPRYRFDLAGPADDADLRHVLANTPMPGDIALTFCREPSFFAAPGVDGVTCQVVACRHLPTNRIVGFGCRSLRRVYVNGQPETIGYLSTLRLLPEHRDRGQLARGYRYFRDLHQDGQTPLYLTTIAEGNDAALNLLTSGRAGLPVYHAAGRYHTVAIPVGASLPPIPHGGLYVRNATQEDLPVLFSFVEKEAPRRQFFPCYDVADMTSSTGALFGLRAEEVLLAYRDGALVGVLAGWDQHAFRQTIVHGYAGPLRWVRPIYNGWARLRGRPTMPRPGQPLRYLTAALATIENDEPAVLAALVHALLRQAKEGPWDYVAFGLADGDPLLETLRNCKATWYTTRIFHVVWPDGEDFRRTLAQRTPYLELGRL